MSFLKKKNIIFISLILILNILLMLLFKYKNSQTYIQELSNQFYSTNSIELIDSDINKYLEFLKNKNDYRLFVEFDNTFRFFKSNDENWTPPILEGTFFSSEKGDKNAVVGKNLIENIQKVNGLHVIKFNNEYYEVTGIMGENFPTRIDSLILLSSYKVPKVDNAKIVIDSGNKSLIKNLTEFALSENDSKLLEKEALGLNRIFKTDFFSKFFVVNSILVVIFSILAYLRYWFEKELRFLKVLNLLGFRRKKITLIYLKNIILNVAISSIFSILVAYIFQKTFTLDILLKSIILTNITTVAISMLYISYWSNFTKNSMRRTKK